jgi:hypothetical protein
VPLLLFWLKSSIVFSQAITLNSKGDTLLCFSIPQSKFLLKTYYGLQECKANDTITANENKALKTIISTKDKEIAEQKELTAKTEQEVSINKEAISRMIQVVNDQNNSIVKLQRKNYLLSVLGATGTLVMGVLYLTQLIKP